MKLIKLFISLLLVAGAIWIPFYFEDLIYYFVSTMGMGWVFSTVLIRVLVIILFLIALKLIFSLFVKTKKWKNWLIIAIGFVPGFLISFAIAPIYSIDYGMIDAGLVLPDRAVLEKATNNKYIRSTESEQLVFLDVGCHFCQIACKKLSINKNNGQNIPIHLFFMNTEKDVKNFLKKNNGEDLNYYLIDSDENFIHYAGFSFPSIFLVNGQGETVNHWIGEQMNYSALDYLLGM